MYNRDLPQNDDKESRMMSLIFAVIFSIPAFILFYAAFHQTLWLLIFAFLCSAVSMMCFYGFLIRLKAQRRFQQNIWNEEKVRKMMEENENILRKAQRESRWIPEGMTPRYVSLGLRLALLLALVPQQRSFVKKGDGLAAYGVLLFLQYISLAFLGTALVRYDLWSPNSGIAEKGIAFGMFCLFFIFWSRNFLQGWRTLHLLQCGQETVGLVRRHNLTGDFYQYFDTNGNTFWKDYPYSLFPNKKKVTILFDAHEPCKSIILDELIQLKQISLTAPGVIRLARYQIFPILMATILWIAVVTMIFSPVDKIF